MNLSLARSRRGFTLLEIMIVVSVVAILSWLAMVAIGRIKDRTARTIVINNLRQLYDAKEYYFSETGAAAQVPIGNLMQRGYVTRRLAVGLFDYRANSLDLKMGWHYPNQFSAGTPTYAFTGTKPANAAPTGEIIYYPGPPADAAALFKLNVPTHGIGSGATAAAAVGTTMAGSTPMAPRVGPGAQPKLGASGGQAQMTFTVSELASTLRITNPDPQAQLRVSAVSIERGGSAVIGADGKVVVSFGGPPIGAQVQVYVTFDNGNGTHRVGGYIVH